MLKFLQETEIVPTENPGPIRYNISHYIIQKCIKLQQTKVVLESEQRKNWKWNFRQDLPVFTYSKYFFMQSPDPLKICTEKVVLLWMCYFPLMSKIQITIVESIVFFFKFSLLKIFRCQVGCNSPNVLIRQDFTRQMGLSTMICDQSRSNDL